MNDSFFKQLFKEQENFIHFFEKKGIDTPYNREWESIRSKFYRNKEIEYSMIDPGDLTIAYDGYMFYVYGRRLKEYAKDLKTAGFKYRKQRGRFETRNIETIQEIKNVHKEFNLQAPHFQEIIRKQKESEARAKERYKQAEKEEEYRFEHSSPLVPSKGFKVKTPKDIKLYNYQAAGVEQLIHRNKCLLADEMGLGKTVQVITAINHFSPQTKPKGRQTAATKKEKILIICPPSMILTWEREWNKFTTRKDLTVTTVTSKSSKTSIENYDVLIVGYSLFSRENKLIQVLKKVEYDLLVLDEAHYYKNYTAKRTVRILAKQGKGGIKAKRIWMLTGTPILNRPAELFPLVNKLAKSYFPNKWEFMNDFTLTTYNGWAYVSYGIQNADELQELLKFSILVRRSKEQVLKELPDKTQQMVSLPAGSVDEKHSLKEENDTRRIIEKNHAFNEKIKQKVKSLNPKRRDYQQVKKQLFSQRLPVEFQLIPVVRHKTALAKLPQDTRIIKDLLENEDKKLIVFAHHKDVMHQLQSSLIKFNPVLLTGDMKLDERMKVIDTFQNDKECRLFIGSILASSEGITLTAANHIIFCEIEWSPAKMKQAEDRAHRIGQKSNLLVQYLVLEHSYDANMVEQLLEKKEIIDSVMDFKDV